MPNKNIKTKFLGNVIDTQKESFEYFIRYEGRGTGTDSIQGIVVEANSAKDVIEKLGEELDYFKLLNIRKL